MTRAILLVLAAGLVLAQPPILRRRPAGTTGPGPSRPTPTGGSTAETDRTFHAPGVLVSLSDKQLVLAADDGRELTAALTKDTVFTKPAAELRAGDRVKLDYRRASDASPIATRVEFEKAAVESANRDPAVAGEAAAAVSTTVVRDRDELGEGRPKLKRGAPAPSPVKEDDSLPAAPPAPAASSPPLAPAGDPVIARAQRAAIEFTEGLPNYIVQQVATWYGGAKSRQPNWQAQDVVTAEVVVDAGKESYRSLTVNGKKTSKPIEEATPGWSRGEFATAMIDVLARSNARFTYRRNETIARLATRVYDFKVEQAFSHWRVGTAGQTVQPAYRGSIWIEPESGRVLRLEQQAEKLPEEFTLDAVEVSLEYAPVRIGTGEFLLPVRSENLACMREAPVCTRALIEFRNYKRFGSESSITFEKQ